MKFLPRLTKQATITTANFIVAKVLLLIWKYEQLKRTLSGGKALKVNFHRLNSAELSVMVFMREKCII